jgi:hypothetical protein
MKYNKFYKMGEVLKAMRGFILSAVSAGFGSSLSAAESTITTAADPKWFIMLSPILQTAAWTVAIVAGIFTVVKVCKELKKLR